MERSSLRILREYNTKVAIIATSDLRDGILYDRNGDIEYKGDLVYDPSNSLVTCESSISNYTQFLKVPNNTMNRALFFSLTPWAYSLKEIEIGDYCFCNVKLCDIVGLGELETIVIGQNSFFNDNNNDEEDDSKKVNGIWSHYELR